MKTLQKLVLVGVLAAMLVVGSVSAKGLKAAPTFSADYYQTLTRKVNEYEGQH